uniref:Uncharacterized protein n=1 Tax=Arundo donax TaxID=35708 RepID=A0A0A8YRI8_ARUDO
MSATCLFLNPVTRYFLVEALIINQEKICILSKLGI